MRLAEEVRNYELDDDCQIASALSITYIWLDLLRAEHYAKRTGKLKRTG